MEKVVHLELQVLLSVSPAMFEVGSKCKLPQLSASYPIIPRNHANIPNLFKISNVMTHVSLIWKDGTNPPKL